MTFRTFLFGMLTFLLVSSAAEARFPRAATGATGGGASFITISCPGTGTTSSTLTCSGTYVGTAPSTGSWSYSWSATCTGSGTPTISGIGGGNITTITVPSPTSGCTGSLQATDNLARTATSGSVTFTTPGPLALLRVENGLIVPAAFGNTYTVGGVGTFTGTAPSSMTATISGCGGGSLAVSGLLTPVYGAGTYQIQIAMPSTAGTGCVITVTDNLSRTAASPSIKVLSGTLGSTIVSNVHNAPGWIASHAYSTTGVRVLNGAGWTPGSPGHFNSGAALNAYQLTSGSCTSASSGGPTGTGSSIGDGSCIWAYKSGVDYVTLSGWGIDAPLWTSGKTYLYYETMTIVDGGVLRAYQLDGGNPFAFCPSTAPPTGTGSPGGGWSTGQQTTSDGCIWDYLGDVTYSSQVANIPTMTYVNNNWGATGHMDRPYTALLWNDAEYVAGSGGERNPIGLFGHYGNQTNLEGNLQGSAATLTITAATGEGFASSLTTSTPLAGYDATKGVAISNSNATGAWLAAATNNFGPAGLFAWDWYTNVNGLQIKSTAGTGLFGINVDVFTNNIIDGGFNNIGSNNAWCMAVWVDNLSVVANNLVLSHGCAGIGAKYGSNFILWNTFVNVGGVSNTSALLYNWTWVFQDIAFADNAVSGYSHVAAELSSGHGGGGPSPLNSRSVGNVTDVAGPDNTGTTWWVDQTTASSNVTAAPGTTFGVSAASMFVSPGSDYRPNTGLSTAGVAFGTFYPLCYATPIPCPSDPSGRNIDSPDILGNTRPNGASQYSTGAEQHP